MIAANCRGSHGQFPMLNFYDDDETFKAGVTPVVVLITVWLWVRLILGRLNVMLRNIGSLLCVQHIPMMVQVLVKRQMGGICNYSIICIQLQKNVHTSISIYHMNTND